MGKFAGEAYSEAGSGGDNGGWAELEKLQRTEKDAEKVAAELYEEDAPVVDEQQIENGAKSEEAEVSPEVVKAQEAERGRTMIGLIEAVRPTIGQLAGMCRGSRGAEQAATMLIGANQNMMETSGQYVSVSESEKDLGEIQDILEACKVKLEDNLGYSEQAVKTIHDKARTLPPNLAGPMIHLCQQIENTYGMTKGVLRWRGDDVVTMPIDKRVQDEAELRELPDENGIVRKDYGSLSSVM